MPFQRLRGFKDIYGEEARLFEKAESAARVVFKNFGFEELRTPILEEKDLFVRALGTETDVVQKEMYEFEDRSKSLVALRPEGTAGVVRAYLENNFDKTQGHCKFFYRGPMFRSERPQAGRLRQFHQIGVEQLGTDSPYADAETIHCLTAFLDALNIRDYKVRLNNLGTLEERASFKTKLVEYFTPLQAKLCEDCRARLSKNVFRLLDCKVDSCRALVRQAPSLLKHLSDPSRHYFETVCEALELSGVSYEIDERLVRGLDYYTKTVFEVSHPKLGAQDALGAGGRYDGLVETFGGPKTGAVGFAIGVERLVMCLSGETAEVDAGTSFFIATLGDNAQKEGYKLLSRLRASGLDVQMDFAAKSLKSQMRAADKHKSRYVMILGDDEIAKKSFMLKNMADGSQTEQSLDDAVSILKKKAI